jgi:hypothetical protein
MGSDDFKFDAVDGAHGDAQLTPCAKRLDHGVHAFVSAHDGVSGARIQAQGATNAPVFIHDGNMTNALFTME